MGHPRDNRQPRTPAIEPTGRQRLSRRKFLAAAAGASVALSFAGSFRGLARAAAAGGRAAARRLAPVGLTPGQRATLRGLWDAAVPGTWNGVVEDWLAPGVAAPGADDARVQDWLDNLDASLPPPLDALTTGFYAWWADDLDLWADVFHAPLFDGTPKFSELPLGPTLKESGRQYKVMLMTGLFHTIVDLKYLAGMSLAKLAFYCDFYNEIFDPQTRVGRKYIGFPLPPGTTPQTNFTYNRVLGDADSRCIRVGPTHLVALP